MQKNWIGRSTGMHITFELENVPEDTEISALDVYTTRPDTLFGASFCAISADHPLARALAAHNPDLAEFNAECRRAGTSLEAIETAEKKGFATGLAARHPFVANRPLPIYVANFVLMDYGTGAIFGCPAHDQRDLEFANAQGLPVRPVVVPDGADPATYRISSEAYIGDGRLANSDFLDGLNVEDAKALVAKKLKSQLVGGAPQGRKAVNYRLRDWGVSRQRYWGCPIPVIHCPACGVVPVPRGDLPVELPDDVNFDTPGNPLDRHPSWRNVKCPECGAAAARETDTFDTFVDSSWYFARFCGLDPNRPTDLRAVNIGCPLISISAGWNTPYCIFCIRGFLSAPCASPSISALMNPSTAFLPKAW